MARQRRQRQCFLLLKAPAATWVDPASITVTNSRKLSSHHVRSAPTSKSSGGRPSRGAVTSVLITLLLTAGIAWARRAADGPSPRAVTGGDVAEQPVLGMDTWRYPGDSVMERWRRASPYAWVGYYLAAPCRVDSSWVGKRSRLTRMGWGVAVLYLGQQAWQHPGGHSGDNAPRPGGSGSCSPVLPSSARGRLDGADAIRNARRDGFPRGTVIFLDVERMDSVSHRMRDYYTAWARTLIADRRYRVGVYAHTRNVDDVVGDVRTECRRARATACPQVWVAAPRGFARSAPPAASGHAFADIWQGVLDTAETWGGVRVPIDVNASTRPSPSAPPSLRPR